ncbi:uncharacterized protein LOC123538551 [Mercenaria mercenaria]|uniref:uncharacterized protein LOC123538551 n=1 Tax=Mercenaria mercenaria TaxID=6596 RepID=UPI00234EE6CF|nr:uncharacterized protein LOC123538551 [Mercenaria mercenaria]
MERQNNLELYLNDVYEKECVFKMEKDEVEFIQTGIEYLVQVLVDQALTDLSDYHLGLSHIIDNDLNVSYILEVYFPIKDKSCLQRYVARNISNEKTFKNTIIKVGSFYDGSKNNFPDEFDFIFLLLGVGEPWRFSHDMDMNNFIHKILHEKVYENEKPFHYFSFSEKDQVKRKLELEKSIEMHGPAYTLRFIYNNEVGKQRYIHVDLVPAYKIIDSKTRQWFVESVRKYVEPATFREEILAADNSLFVKEHLDFTEMEKHFMNNILSRKHMKVYRILKFLINGNGDGEELEKYSKKGSGSYYSSYRIKTLMIYHHEACTNTVSGDLGPCILQVLEECGRYKNAEDFPKFISKEYPYKQFMRSPTPKTPFSLLPYLISAITILRSLQTSHDSYDYERCKMQSISRQYLGFLMADKQTLQ